MPTEKKTATKKVEPKTETTTEEVIVVKEEKVTERTKVAKVYKNTDRVPCKSITAGELIYFSTKTKERYEWSNYGDMTDVLYEDLLSMKSSKSDFIYKPYFVIDDAELVSQSGWNKISDLYDSIDIVEDAEDYLDQTPEKLRELLNQAPEGVKNTIKITASQMINSGELYDVRIVKVIDEVLGTDFKTFMV